ncbi:MAG: FG-GAP-like repeat-containing protein [Thermoguttaceae bacterium]
MTTRRERKPQRVVSAALVATLLAAALQGAGAEDAKTLPIVRGGAADAVIVVGPEASEVVGNAALTLQEEIQRRTGAKLAIQTMEKTGPGLTRIYLGTQDRCQSLGRALGPLAQRPVTADRPGKEGFQLLSGSESGDPVVVVNGCDDLGTFHGVGWLLRRMRFRQAEAALPAGLRLATAPASEMRRIRFGDHCGYVNTELPGWRDIWSDYVLWGLSAVTFRCDPAHQGDPRESKLARMLWDKWTERVPLARSLGLEIVHLTQTNLAFKDGEFGPAGIPNFPKINFMCPDFNGVNPKFPEGRAALRASRTWFFDHLPCIEQVNYYLTSGWDGGGCNDPAVAPWSCTYADLVDTIVYPALAKHNPKAKIILGLYAVPGVGQLAKKFADGWNPPWLYAVEFDHTQVGLAKQFPLRYKRIFFPLWVTDLGSWYQTMGANPYPKRCKNEFRQVYNDCQIRDGLGCYSEGTHDYVNQILMMQQSWDPQRPMEEILDELCRYYFGEEAAPVVKELFYLLEAERPDDFANPRVNPRVQQLAAEAERLMPPWAKSSRQWAMVVGRVGLDRTLRRQADLLPKFAAHWQRYRSLLKSKPAESRPPWFEETRAYFESLVSNARDQEKVNKRLDRDGYGAIGGGQFAEWPDPKTGGALEALRTISRWRAGQPATSAGRWCCALVDHEGFVCVADGWGNLLRQTAVRAGDAQMVIANLYGDGANRLVYLGADGRLYSWNPGENTNVPLTKTTLLSGPLAAGDLRRDGRDEVLALAGKSTDDARLAVVDAQGSVTMLDMRPAGLAPERPAQGIHLRGPALKRPTRLDVEPRVKVCDFDGDGKAAIICADRDGGNRLVVLDAAGKLKQTGPAAPSGPLAVADLDGDGRPYVLYLDASGCLRGFSAKPGELKFAEEVKPLYPSTVAVAKLNRDSPPEVVYADSKGLLRAIRPGGASRLLSAGMPSTAAIGPGMVVGDFNGDGQDQVCYLRRRLFFLYPLGVLCTVDGQAGFRILPLYSYPRPSSALFAPELGPRASGTLCFPQAAVTD